MANFGRKDYTEQIKVPMEKSPDEPMLLIRGADALAPWLIDILADRIEAYGGDMKVVNSLRVHAETCREYQINDLGKKTKVADAPMDILTDKISKRMQRIMKDQPNLFDEDGNLKDISEWRNRKASLFISEDHPFAIAQRELVEAHAKEREKGNKKRGKS